MHCKCKDRPNFGALSKQGLCHLCTAADTIKKFFQKQNSERKNQNFWFMEKQLSTISFMEKCLSLRFYTIFCMYRTV